MTKPSRPTSQTTQPELTDAELTGIKTHLTAACNYTWQTYTAAVREMKQQKRAYNARNHRS